MTPCRRDPLVAAAVGKADPTGENRVRVADRGAALAGKSTLNRLELVGSKDAEADRYKKVTYDEAGLGGSSNCFQELLELFCLGSVGTLMCMIGDHLIEHENTFTVGSVIRKAVDWLLFRVHAVRADSLN